MFYTALGLLALGTLLVGLRARKEYHHVAVTRDDRGKNVWGWADVRYSAARLGGPVLLVLAFLALLVAR